MQREDGIYISQSGYAKEILKRFGMESCNPVNTLVESGLELRKSTNSGNVDPTYFKSLVGSLRYLSCTRLDILYGVRLISRYMEALDQSHLDAAKRILRYIKGTINDGLHSLDTLIVIGEDIWMKERVLQVLLSTWEMLHSLGHLKSKQLSLCLLVKKSM